MKPRGMGAVLMVLLASSSAEAGLVRLRVDRREVVLGGKPFGLAGPRRAYTSPLGYTPDA